MHDIFLAGKHANPLNISLHFQLLGLHNAYQFNVLLAPHLLPFGCNLKGSFEIPNFWALGECQGIGICTNRKLTHDFPMPLNTKFCSLYLPPFDQKSNVKLRPSHSTLR